MVIDRERYARMAERAKERARARGELTQAMLAEEFGPALPGENEHIEDDRDDEHYGHRTHIHPSHGNAVWCSCGPYGRGGFSVIVDEAWQEAARQPCPICAVRLCRR